MRSRNLILAQLAEFFTQLIEVAMRASIERIASRFPEQVAELDAVLAAAGPARVTFTPTPRPGSALLQLLREPGECSP